MSGLVKNAPDFLPDEPPRVMKATQKEMMDARVPLRFRDFCAHLYMPLMKCRFETGNVPWRCKEEKHEWEECEVQDYYRRMRDKHRQTLAERAEEKQKLEQAKLEDTAN